jgi:hypothetical protein
VYDWGILTHEETQPVPKTIRRRRADQFWRDAIAAWKESGQTVTAFCAARGIGESTFFAKRRALRERAPHAPAPVTSFAAVRVIPDPNVEIVVPGGIILRAPVGAEPTAVAQLVLALRGVPC